MNNSHPSSFLLRPTALLGGPAKWRLAHWARIVPRIAEYEEQFRELDDRQLREKVAALRRHVEDGEPIASQPYEVTCPDGSVASGTLDQDGRARIEGIADTGDCQITFPDLDKSAWDLM